MKKILTLAAVVFFVFTLAAATYAVDFKASGLIRVRTAWFLNAQAVGGGGTVLRADEPNFDDSEAWVDERFRLQMSLVASEDLRGVIYFEGDSTAWGEAAGTRNALGSWGADRPGIEAKQFYIDFKVPGLKDTLPTDVRAGVQWLAIRSHVFQGADGPGIRVFTNPGPLRLYLNWFKPGEGSLFAADDVDFYSTRGVLALPDFPIQPGFFVAYWNANSYPTNATTGDQAEFIWVGVNVDGKVGPASIQTDFIYVDGEVDIRAPLAQDSNYKGWLAWADVSVPLGMVTVGGTFMYATGNDVTDTTALTGDLDFDGYVIPPGSEANPQLSVVFFSSPVHDGVNIASSNGRESGSAVQPRKFGGLWAAKGYGSFKPLDWLKVTGYAMYIGDTTKDGNTIGNAVDLTEASGLEDESYIGVEVGAIVDINVYKNLTYSVGAGYLFAGDALDSNRQVLPVVINDSPDDPWAVVSQLIYTF